jgi:hypothetical protein
MPFVILPTNSISGGYDITNSLRFNSGSTDYLNRTFGTATNTKIFTWSFWVKRTTLGTSQYFFENVGSYGGDDPQGSILFRTDNSLEIFEDTFGAGSGLNIKTTRLFRDVSAWYHIVIAFDSTQATASNRVKLYVNGTQETTLATATYPSQNHALPVISGSGNPCNIGKYDNTNSNFNGYLADIFFIDGQQLTPSSFGETDFDTGIWKPKAYTGTYGTNGFYLQFKNSASLGTDSSGNGNTFTVNNLTSIDQTTDTPTNNFATWNPLDNYYAGSTFTEGNTKVSTASSPYTYNTSTIKMGSGKYYIEGKWTGLGSGNSGVGIVNTSSTATSDEMTAKANGSVLSDSGAVYANGSYTGTNVGSFSTNDIVMIAFDGVNNAIYYGKNGTWLNSGVPTSGASKTGAFTPSSTTGLDYFIGFSDQNSGSGYSIEFNFGNPPYSANSYQDANGRGNFSYSVPSGYYSLCTANLSLYG